MNDLPPLAWILLCVIVAIIAVMNLALVALVRNRNKIKFTAMPRPARSQPGLDNIAKVLRDPFSDERKQLNELSELVHNLDETKQPDTDRE